MSWIQRSSRQVYSNAWITLREDDVITPAGGDGIYGVVSLNHPTVYIVPVTDDDQVVLIRQWRYAISRDSWEVPAGATDGEELVVAARRELFEEAGYAATDWVVLPTIYSLNGVCDAPGTVVVAEGSHRVSEAGALPEEGIAEVRALPWPEVFAWIRRGEITDAASIAALTHAALALGRLG